MFSELMELFFIKAGLFHLPAGLKGSLKTSFLRDTAKNSSFMLVRMCSTLQIGIMLSVDKFICGTRVLLFLYFNNLENLY